MTKSKSKSAGGIVVSYATLLPALMSVGGEMSPYQMLRRQPLPMAFSLMLIDVAKVIGEKIASFEEMQKTLNERHLSTAKPKPAQRVAWQKDMEELKNQEIQLPGRRIPRAVASEARISADALEHLLWLFEPA